MTELVFKLNTGACIPALGLGTYNSEPNEVKNAVAHAIRSGYRHIDCAYCYENEAEVGQGIREALASDPGLKRSDLFITGKLWSTDHTRVQEGLDRSLQLLGLEYFDLYLMHWPCAMNPNGNHDMYPKLADGSRDLVRQRSHVDTYRDMESLLATGKVKAIGVSNYSVKFLEQLLPVATVIPAVNQIENHPLLPQQEVVDLCKLNGILITAYSPFGSTDGPVMKDERIVKIAEELNVAVGTVLLSYHARGHCVLAKSVTPSRIAQNRTIIKLSEQTVASLDAIAKQGVSRFVYPPWGFDFGFPDKS